MVYLWLMTLGKIKCESFQTAFVKKAFDHVDRNQALKAMKEHGVDRQHLIWISKLLEHHSLQMRPGHYEPRRFKNKEASTRSARKPHVVHITGGHQASSTEPPKLKNKIKMRTSIVHGETRCVICRQLLEEVTENLVHEEASASSDAPASISREPFHQEPSMKAVSARVNYR